MEKDKVAYVWPDPSEQAMHQVLLQCRPVIDPILRQFSYGQQNGLYPTPASD